jgi:guanylate kinase
MTFADKFDVVIINDNLEEAILRTREEIVKFFEK